MKRIIHQWKVLLKDRAYSLSFLIGTIVVFLSLGFTQVVGHYKDSSVFPPVGDSLLELLPVYNLEILFIWGFYFLIFLIFLYSVFVKPEKVPFVMKTYGILMFVRACFILLTDVGPPAGFFYENVDVTENIFKELTFRNDLFFSGHTAVPFLAFLIFKDTWFKWLMLGGSVIMGATVLLMHVHYSIDVFAAPFIAHGVYVFSNNVFNNLNIRFRDRIKLYGWNAVQKKLREFKDNIT